jgi:hypothetical protein
MKIAFSLLRANGRRRGWPIRVMSLVVALALLAPVHAQDQPDDVTTIDRANFTLKYPVGWTEDTKAQDYQADSNFTLNSPNSQNTYVQFSIVDKSQDPDKVLKAATLSLDGPAITALSKTKIDEWGGHKGVGIHLKGKILDSYPGGIKVFIFNSEHHNVLVVEYYFSSELKNLQSDIEFISENFTMKN